ncbi:MAG TPA: CheR family methyltransferase [Usitatibacter sp.]|nr:CheR family methyltransferase [Usitatibacter sp.]
MRDAGEPPVDPKGGAAFDLELRLLLEAVYVRYQHDFRHYAKASLRRRVRQAMVRFDCPTVSRLQERVLHDPDAFAAMLQYFTVQVSEMFRDPAYFSAIREKVVPVLATYPFVKIWVAGCSYGEEALSFAIVLHEEGLLERTLIYATDINPEALRVAQAGVYALDRIAGFSTAYLAAGGKSSLADYYSAAYGNAVFDRRLRAQVAYSDHSLATDNVFSEVELVSCRNVLIYFDRDLQSRAIGLFHDALPQRGFLGIGSKESLRFSAHGEAFEEFARAERIYRKR